MYERKKKGKKRELREKATVVLTIGQRKEMSESNTMQRNLSRVDRNGGVDPSCMYGSWM